ncbi:acylphosphatase [Streptococcus mutans]|jgi:acylphosphatase|uniref:acylphosphatase n=1 Tax=Streptococcus mutans SM6 TaxID=857119 RepID=A0A829BJJ1_STRMG|nr:acylphosphatase [Streptococcus mutans]EMB76081.1 acylphosphatase [Streptococcus mutans 2VS1]EMB96304.1 acylphosphatase [Streptococcus mutans G123]EMB96568.1 acylphosphatase [Streptococcus mutans M21]EMC04612.1 acylphosphatase [Streptococcus mutans NLML4]EMC09278.1 acylphosphatase [Streptococcus mutans NLML9]
MKKVRLLVSGRVQGVGFRYSTYNLALEIGDIYGRVWNNDDGTVEILAQSDNAEKLAKFIQEIRKGPSHFSKVTYVDVNIANFSDYHDFRMAN